MPLGSIPQDVRPGTAAGTPERLLYRRQFVLGPSFADLPSWSRWTIGPNLRLTVHPDLNVVQVHDGSRSLTLLGYILDPNAPAADDTAIVRRLLGRLGADGWPAVIKATAALGGRWILIGASGRRVWLFNDPCGYRQVVFTGRGQDFWCASQPGLLAELLGLEPWMEAEAFARSYRETVPGWKGAQYWWPGDTTGYREVRHLLPNHYLDPAGGSVHRFWPEGELAPLPFAETVRRSAHLLRGMIESAARRYDLAMALTAGRDSRLLLAATRRVVDQIQFITLKYWDMTEESVDIVVPRRLAGRLRLGHRVIDCPPAMEPWFERFYGHNVSGAHGAYGVIAQGLWNEYPQDRLFMKGNASFVMHNFDGFRHDYPHGRPVGVEGLQRFSKIGSYPFAAEATRRWWEQAGALYNVDVVSLFYWETKEGKWQATSQLEWDIVQDVLVPFNCRSFMSDALALHHRFRAGPTHYLQRRLMAALWPEVLKEPINAAAWHGGRARRAMRDFLVRRELYSHIRRMRERSGRARTGWTF